MTPPRPLTIALATVLLAALAPRPAGAATTTFVSAPSWSVTDASNNPLGNAEYVVLNGANPTAQPAGAVNYGSAAASGWTADLSGIPGAYWIWAPGVTGSTPNASLAQFSFSQQFTLSGTPTAGTISVAVDDLASVYVNGSLVGSTGSVTDAGTAYQAQSALTSFDIAPYLTAGQNTIRIQAQNGPSSFATGTNPPYSVNTAGVVFGGTITTRDAAVPEPSPLALLAPGLLLGLLPAGRRAARERRSSSRA